MMFEISPTSPVIAATTQTFESGVPELVMNAFDPSITHAPSSSLAVVRMDCADEPPLLLLLGAEPVDGVGPQANGGFECDGHRGVRPGDLLQAQAERQEVAVQAAVAIGRAS